jgi:hypothetical protein
MAAATQAEMKAFTDEMAGKMWEMQKQTARMNFEISKAKNYGNSANRAAKESVAH